MLKRLLASSLLMALIATITPTDTLAASQNPTVNVVALGDSYTAGNGALEYEDTCYRSANAYVHVYAEKLRQTGVNAISSNYACHGSHNFHIAGQINEAGTALQDAEIVLMTISGNDGGFIDIVTDCLAETRWLQLCHDDVNRIRENMDQIISSTMQSLRDVADAAPHAQIVMVGYPYLIAKDCFADATIVRSLQAAADIKSWLAVDDLQKEGYTQIRYESMLVAFEGGEVCGSGPDLIRGTLDTANFNEWWHPNVEGHAVIAQQLFDQGIYSAPEPSEISETSIPEPVYQPPPPPEGQPGYVGLPFECGAIVPFVSTYGTFSHEGESYEHGHALDFPMPRGVGVLAPESGFVEVRLNDSAYGIYVDLTADSGIVHRFAHLDEASVSSGERIERGQQIGTVGSTGVATGPHLHYEQRDSSGQISIDLGGSTLEWGSSHGSYAFQTTTHALVSNNCGQYWTLGSYDIDGDGVQNNLDNCPEVAGPSFNNGCPVDDDIMIIRPDAGKFDFYVDTNQLAGHDVNPIANWGLPGDQFFTGHFNGDHVSDVVLVREDEDELDWYFETNMATPHEAHIDGWGRPGDEVFIADFDQDHHDDDILLVRESPAGRLSFYFDKDRVAGHESAIVDWGYASDRVIIGNFDTDPDDDILLVRENPSGSLSFFFETNQIRGDDARIENWGRVGDQIFVGDFDNDPHHDDDILIVRKDGGALDWYFDFDQASPHEVVIDNWGKPGDDIRIADFGGDTRDDVMLIRYDGSKYDFYVDYDQDKGHDINPPLANWGRMGDEFFIGKFDGDDKADIVLMRQFNGELHWFFETNNATPHERSIDGWGKPGDQIRIADFDGH